MRKASNSALKPLLAVFLTALSWLTGSAFARQPVGLAIAPQAVELTSGSQTWRFTREQTGWALAEISVRGVATARPETRSDSFFMGSGEAQSFAILTNTPEDKALEFRVGTNRVVINASAAERLPLVRIRLLGPATPAFALRSTCVARDEHGAWVTRGFVATDADGSEAFIDSSGPTIFGHSQVARLDACYLFMPRVLEHVQKNGRTEQRSDTYFESRRIPAGNGEYAARWQLRFGAAEPKEFGVVFDRDLGGRVSDVCERYFADAVDTLVDLGSVPMDYDPERCLQMLPVRFAAPDAFTPGYGWMMDEYPNASYPFAHDCTWQVAALLGFEGLATGRVWERQFARYFIDKTPLEGPDGTSYFVRRPGGLVRWAYWSTYKQPFPHFEGGVWWFADILHRTGMALGDARLRSAAIDMVRHDVEVKLDLDKMSYPPCWNAIENRVGDDHRDDWYKTPGLAWCAWAAAALAYPETGEARFLERADRITDWFAGYMVPEQKLNYLQGNNMHAVFSHYIPLAFLERFERTGDRRFLDLARDMAWVHILTACTTAAKDSWGNPLTGVTCVGVRGCVDYDCAPNLCHEKDLTFVHLIGPLLDHVNGSGYAKYLKLQHLILGKDSWKSAWVAEMRETNMRTIYDAYARGMANLIYALDQSTNPLVVAVEKLVSKSDTNIVSRRDLVLANATTTERDTLLRVRFLLPGIYQVTADGQAEKEHSNGELERGLYFRLPPNSMRHVGVRALKLEKPSEPRRRYDGSFTFLSDLVPLAAQRGTGYPQPTYQRDRSFGGRRLTVGSGNFDKGLGCAANTVLIYNLEGQYERFESRVGVDHEVASTTNPIASVFFTAFVDGRLAFESGPMRADTPAQDVNLDVRGAGTLMLRMSCNWDDNGRAENDHGDWADARLAGKRAGNTGGSKGRVP